MKKKIVTFATVMLFSMSLMGCNIVDTMRSIAYNTTDFDYEGYEQLQIGKAVYYLPATVMGEAVDGDMIVTDEENYYVIAQDIKTSVYGQDADEIGFNLEEYLSEYCPYEVTIRNNVTSYVSEGRRSKYIFKDIEVEGIDGQLAYLCGEESETILIVANQDFLDKDTEQVILKSLTLASDR